MTEVTAKFVLVKLWASEMWSVKLRFLHNKAHRGTEWTELNTMHRGVDGTKSDRDEVYRILMPFGVNASCTNL